MSDIFISYSRADRDRAQGLARALGELGFEVWWDRKIPPGKTFDQVIQEALDASDCVVVLWSKTSVASDWVKEEAQAGLAKGALVPVLIDDVPIPLGFGRIQTANLASWNGDLAHPELDQLARSVANLAGGRIDTRSYRLVREEAEPERPPSEPKPTPRTAPRSEPAPLVHAAAQAPPRERRREPSGVTPATIPTPAPARAGSRPAPDRRLPLVAVLVAVLVLAVAGVAYYAWSGGIGAPREVAELGDDPTGIEVPAETTTPEAVQDDEPEAAEADIDELEPEADSAGDSGIGLPAQAQVVPASLDGAGPADLDAREEVETKTPPTMDEAKEAPNRAPETKSEVPREARRPVTPPASEPADPAADILRRAASPDLPLHARRDFLYGNLETLGDRRAKDRLEAELTALTEEMEFSASIIEAKNFVVGSHLVYDNGTPNGAAGVRDSFAPGTVYLFARVRSRDAATLRLEWRQRSGEVLSVENVQVGRNTDPGYRIGLAQTLTDPGRYEVRLYNQKGDLIGLRRFEIDGS